MWLTQRQRRGLEFYRRFRYESLTWVHLFRINLAGYVLCFVFALIAIGVYGAGYAAAALMILCLLIGFQLRDAMWQNGILELWPAVHEVIDWDKLEQLLDSQTGEPRPEGE